jgi:Tol biopolymer transport system component
MRRLASLVLLLALITAVGCSSSRKETTASPQSEAGTTAPAAGETGYITAIANKLQDVILGGKARTVVSFDDGSSLMDPALSPDGKHIAFIRQEPVKNLAGGQIDFGADMYIVARDGSGLKELAHHSALAEYIRGPAWVDDGHLLFSVRGRDAAGAGDYRLERMDLASGQRTRLNQNAVDPSVAPGARQMLYISVETATTRETVMLADIDGSNARDLLPLEPPLSLIGSAVMSPDGTQVAFAAGDLNGAFSNGGTFPRAAAFPLSPIRQPAMLHPFFQDVWLINADGTNLRRLAEVVERSLSLSWSPDGTSIYAMGTEQFRRVDVATGEVTVLGEGAPQAGVFVYEEK